MDTLLLVDDDNLLRYALRLKLEKEGYVILEATSGQRAMQIVQQHPVHLVLLDIGLPDSDGLDILQLIRQVSRLPVIVISADQSIGKKVRSLDLGADDYLAKPLDTEELAARIRVNLNRYRLTAGTHPERKPYVPLSDAAIRIGQWQLNRERFDIFDDNEHPGNLTLPEFQLLDLMARQAGKVVRRDELCRAVCIDNYVPTPRAIDIKITRLRKKLGDIHHPPRIIRTVRGIGYMIDKEMLTAPTAEQSFSLPSSSLTASKPHEPSLTIPARRPLQQAESNPRLANLLLVEDDDADIELTRTLLLDKYRLRCNFMIARNGAQALELLHRKSLEQEKVDFMLLDITMPDMTGFQLLEHMRNEASLAHIPVAMCTASTCDTDIDRARLLGAIGYLNKPARLEDLKHLLGVAATIRLQHEDSGYSIIRAA